MAEYKGKLLKGLLKSAKNVILSNGENVENVIAKSYDVSGTTNASGNFFTVFGSDYTILGVRVTTPSDHYIIPYYSALSGKWALRLKKWDDTTQANISFNATIIVTHQ